MSNDQVILLSLAALMFVASVAVLVLNRLKRRGAQRVAPVVAIGDGNTVGAVQVGDTYAVHNRHTSPATAPWARRRQRPRN